MPMVTSYFEATVPSLGVSPYILAGEASVGLILFRPDAVKSFQSSPTALFAIGGPNTARRSFSPELSGPPNSQSRPKLKVQEIWDASLDQTTVLLASLPSLAT